jgi:hypothetical protein
LVGSLPYGHIRMVLDIGEDHLVFRVGLGLSGASRVGLRRAGEVQGHDHFFI